MYICTLKKKKNRCTLQCAVEASGSTARCANAATGKRDLTSKHSIH